VTLGLRGVVPLLQDPHPADRALVAAATRLEEAWAWGLDPDLWRAHLGPRTWPGGWLAPTHQHAACSPMPPCVQAVQHHREHAGASHASRVQPLPCLQSAQAHIHAIATVGTLEGITQLDGQVANCVGRLKPWQSFYLLPWLHGNTRQACYTVATDLVRVCAMLTACEACV